MPEMVVRLLIFSWGVPEELFNNIVFYVLFQTNKSSILCFFIQLYFSDSHKQVGMGIFPKKNKNKNWLDMILIANKCWFSW